MVVETYKDFVAYKLDLDVRESKFQDSRSGNCERRYEKMRMCVFFYPVL